jgi:hypothetical protein
MGIISKDIKVVNSSATQPEEFALNKKEIEWLLTLIKESTFRGAD